VARYALGRYGSGRRRQGARALAPEDGRSRGEHFGELINREVPILQ
jgi:hypothetical protein